MKNVENIIAAVDVSKIKQELNKDRFIRNTRKGGNEIYIVNAHNSPNVIKEIGRLREISFRDAGGGTGLALDLDIFDTSETCYEQLIVWSPDDEEIVGGYRFIKCEIALNDSKNPNLSTANYFDFTADFTKNYLPKTIELGRSWVQPNFQPHKNPRKGLFALDNIWDGLGALTVVNPEIEYFFGKVTMYPDYNRECRDFLLYFMHFYFPDNEKLMQPFFPLVKDTLNDKEFHRMLTGLTFKDGFKVLNQYIRARGENVPPLVNIYMHLSSTMKTFGTAVNPEFGGVEETAILVKIADVYEDKKVRHIDTMSLKK